MYVCMYVCMHVLYEICMCMHVCMYVCMYVWMDGWMDGYCAHGFECTSEVLHLLLCSQKLSGDLHVLVWFEGIPECLHQLN